MNSTKNKFIVIGFQTLATSDHNPLNYYEIILYIFLLRFTHRSNIEGKAAQTARLLPTLFISVPKRFVYHTLLLIYIQIH